MQSQSARKRLGVMGGTFDPIHVGHLVAASEVLYGFDLDLVLFVPTGQPWQKQRYSPPEDRYMMTVLGIASNPCFAASRMEIDRKGPTYTADTMETLYAFHEGEVDLFFIAGADAVLRLRTWVALDRVAQLAEVIAVTRPGFDLHLLQDDGTLPTVREMEMPQIAISSSEIRARVASGRPIDYLVPEPVARYIVTNGLYAAPARD
jgi:nicotinate-nucleotide adenylyltransferase